MDLKVEKLRLTVNRRAPYDFPSTGCRNMKCTILVFREIGPVSRSTESAAFGIFGVAFAVCARQFLLIGLRQQQQQQHDH